MPKNLKIAEIAIWGSGGDFDLKCWENPVELGLETRWAADLGGYFYVSNAENLKIAVTGNK